MQPLAAKLARDQLNCEPIVRQVDVQGACPLRGACPYTKGDAVRAQHICHLGQIAHTEDLSVVEPRVVAVGTQVTQRFDVLCEVRDVEGNDGPQLVEGHPVCGLVIDHVPLMQVGPLGPGKLRTWPVSLRTAVLLDGRASEVLDRERDRGLGVRTCN